MKKPTLLSITTCAVISSVIYGSSFAQIENQNRDSFRSTVARFTEGGELVRPNGWRKWAYIGTPVTPNDMNSGNAAFPEFHNVYMDPDSFSAYEKTGVFPEGTMIAKELVSVGSKAAVSGNGYFMGDFQGLEIALKDTRRFGREPGGWAYFSFGHEKRYSQTARILPTEKCNSCHQARQDS